MKQLPVEFIAVLSAMILSVCGGYRLMFMGIFSYLIDITTTENRVFRCTWILFSYLVIACQSKTQKVYIFASSINECTVDFVQICPHA